jgi:hypothetical protein
LRIQGAGVRYLGFTYVSALLIDFGAFVLGLGIQIGFLSLVMLGLFVALDERDE